MDSLEQIKETAASWVAKRHGAQWTQSDEAALDRWLSASMGNRVEYLGHEKTWRDANRLKVLGAGSKPGATRTIDARRASPYFKHFRKDDPPETEEGREVRVPARSTSLATEKRTEPRAAMEGPGKQSKVRVQLFGLAASVLVICAVSCFGWSHLRGDRYATSTGITTAIPLSDGSKITLNTASEIHVVVTQTERRINLDHGEAFFEVAKDPLRPFTVIAGDKRIVAVGTKFSVRRNLNDLKVIVTEGKVRLDPAKPGRLASSREGKGAPDEGKVLLTAGNIAETRDDQLTVQQRPLPQAEELLSWREGYLMFDEVTLAEAVAEFNRYNTQKFVIRDPAIASVPVTGHFRSTSIESFATLLEQGFPVVVTRESDKFILDAPSIRQSFK